MNSKIKSFVIFLGVVAVTAGFLGFTASGHSLLAKVGLATACSDGSCN